MTGAALQITDTQEGRVYMATASVTTLGAAEPIMCAPASLLAPHAGTS